MNNSLSILKLHEVIERTKKCKTAIWKDVQDGLFPPPIKVGKASAGYIEGEVNALLMARSINFDDEQLKDLVSTLVKKRKESASRFIAELTA